MSARFRPSAGFWDAYQKLYGRPESRYRRDLLPDPLEYYTKHLHALRVKGEWTTARCPFHHDKNPSFSINLVHGGYNCHACGAKGGDVLDFHRRLTGMGFIDAAKALNAWEEA
jgi:hypothetical protein